MFHLYKTEIIIDKRWAAYICQSLNISLFLLGSDYGQIPEELWQFFLTTYGGGPELMLHSCQRPVPAQPNVSVHSASNPNLMDQNLKCSRIEAKSNKLCTTKSSETISQQDSAIESLTSDSDSHHTQKDVSE